MARGRRPHVRKRHSSMPAQWSCALIVPALRITHVRARQSRTRDPARTMQEMRDVVQDLVVNQTRRSSRRFWYSAIRWAASSLWGYRTDWPEAVQDWRSKRPPAGGVYDAI